MTLALVEHDAPEPAVYGALAAALAAARGDELMHLPHRLDTRAYADAIQHVAAAGALVASGLVWLERLARVNVGPEAAAEAILAEASRRAVVVPYHPCVAASEVFADLAARAARSGVAVEHVCVSQERGTFTLRDRASGKALEVVGPWTRDAFGRFAPAPIGLPARPAGPPPLRIGLVGTERDHRAVYPAVLAAVGDAADAESMSVEVVYIPPRDVREQDVGGALQGVDGLLLPGGSDMANVPGQILMAHAALRTGTPALGLCLGMQTMTTAVAQKALGSARVSLAEADPDAALKTFTAMVDSGLPAHRLGEETMYTDPSSRLAGLLGPEARIRCNHRYHLNADLVPVLATAGLRVTALDATGRIADAVELQGHPFYIGLQGHPELSSRVGAAHPLLRAFLRACRGRSRVAEGRGERGGI